MIRATQDTPTLSTGFRVRDFHLLRSDFPDSSTNLLKCDIGVLQPQGGRNLPGLGYSPFARHYLGNHVCFLFLPVLRCFSSRGSPPCIGKDDRPSACRVAPFRNPRVKGRLHLTAAYRSLPRLSSPTRAQESTMCPFLLSPHRNMMHCCNLFAAYTFSFLRNYKSLEFLLFVCFFFNLRSLALFDFSFPVPICQRSMSFTIY